VKNKFHRSVYFEDGKSDKLFLFQLINFGKNTDELKFAFNYPAAGTGTVYSPPSTFSDAGDIVGTSGEITYHSDGSFLHKFPNQIPDGGPSYVNPFGTGLRRTPLNQLTEWEPILVYTVVDYGICRKPLSGDAFMVPFNPHIFEGDPFTCVIGVGSSANVLPSVDPTQEVVTRIPSIGNGLDLVLDFTKTKYRGREIRVPDTDIRIWSKHNELRVLYYKGNAPQ